MTRVARQSFTLPPGFVTGVHCRKSPAFAHPGSAPANPLGEHFAAAPMPSTVQALIRVGNTLCPGPHMHARGGPLVVRLLDDALVVEADVVAVVVDVVVVIVTVVVV